MVVLNFAYLPLGFLEEPTIRSEAGCRRVVYLVPESLPHRMESLSRAVRTFVIDFSGRGGEVDV